MASSVFLPLSLLLMVIASSTMSSSACSITTNNKVTFYGYPDNDPPGAGTAYNCGGRNNVAGGVGTYANPLTFASAQGEYSSCEIIYLPYLQKYLRYEDECAECTSDWSNGNAHIDIWTGSSTVNGGTTQENCEDALTPDQNQGVVRQPATNLPVNSKYNEQAHIPSLLPSFIHRFY
jgi:hypothetical protein